MKFIIGKTYNMGIFLMIICFLLLIFPHTSKAENRPARISGASGTGLHRIFSNAVGISIATTFRLGTSTGTIVASNRPTPPSIATGTTISDASITSGFVTPPIGSFPCTSSNGRSCGGAAWAASLPLDGTFRAPVYTSWLSYRAQGVQLPVTSTTQQWSGTIRSRYTLSSTNSNIISCVNNTCRAVGPGSATVRYTPNSGSFTVLGRGISLANNNTGCSAAEIAAAGSPGSCRNQGFSFNGGAMDFEFNVFIPQQAPTVRYTSTTSISYNNATSNWSYSDANGDIPTTSTVRYYTNAGRTVLGASETVTGNVRSATESGLRAGTTYWPTVFVNNGVNAPVRADGNAFTTRSYPQSAVTFNVVDRNGGETIAGDPIQFQWTVTNTIGVVSCTAFTGGNPNIDTRLWNGNKPIGANRTENRNLPRSQVQKTYTFRLRCTPKPGAPSIPDAVKTITVKGTPSTLTLTVNDSTNPPSITGGQNVTVKWNNSVPNVITGCTASTSGGNNIWTGDKPKSGNERIVIPFSQVNRTYNLTLRCNSIDGNAPTKTVPIVVQGTPATVNLKINDINGRNAMNLRPGDRPVIVWTITNPAVLTRCTGSTINPAGSTLFTGDKSKNSSSETIRIDTNLATETNYTFRLTCDAIDGTTPISANVNAKVIPKPIVSCDLTNKVVSESNGTIKLNLNVSGGFITAPYTWTINKGFGNTETFGTPNTNSLKDLDYADAVLIGLGKYDVKVSVRDGAGLISDEANCGTVTSLGNRTIREVAP